MESLNETVSTVYSKTKRLESNSIQLGYTVEEIQQLIGSMQDLIPDDGYQGFYVNSLKTLGRQRFMELAAKARTASNTPQRLFCWMLKNSARVR